MRVQHAAAARFEILSTNSNPSQQAPGFLDVPPPTTFHHLPLPPSIASPHNLPPPPPTTLRWSFSTCFQVSPSFEFVDFFPNVACPLPLQPVAVAGGGCIFTVPASPPVRVDAGGTEGNNNCVVALPIKREGNNAGVSSVLCFLVFAAPCMQQDVSVSAYVFIRVPLAHALLLQRPSSRCQC